MKSVCAIDPGMMTGIVWLNYTDGDPPVLDAYRQEPGGMKGMVEYLPDPDYFTGTEPAIVVEKFSPRPGARSWKLAELEPLRIEGMLEDRFGTRITWQKPEQRKLLNTLPRTEQFLRDSGYWITPKMVGHRDANDVNAATMHALAYLRDQRHIPTIEMLIEYGDLHMEEDS